MFYFAGNVTDTKTNKSKYVALCSEREFWRDHNRIRYHKRTGDGLLVKRLNLDVTTIFPIIFTHTGFIKNNKRDTGKMQGDKVFLTLFDTCAWITHKKEFYHAGHGLNLDIKLKGFKIVPGDHRKYLVLSSVEELKPHISYKNIESYRYVL